MRRFRLVMSQMNTEFLIEKELVRIAVSGQVAGERHGRQILDLLEEKAISSQPAVLWDAREATIQLGPIAFCRYARVFLRSVKPIERKVAVMVGDPTAASLFLILKTLMAKWPTKYRLFQDESDARLWLTSTSRKPTLSLVPCRLDGFAVAGRNLRGEAGQNSGSSESEIPIPGNEAYLTLESLIVDVCPWKGFQEIIVGTESVVRI